MIFWNIFKEKKNPIFLKYFSIRIPIFPNLSRLRYRQQRKISKKTRDHNRNAWLLDHCSRKESNRKKNISSQVVNLRLIVKVLRHSGRKLFLQQLCLRNGTTVTPCDSVTTCFLRLKKKKRKREKKRKKYNSSIKRR